LRGLGALVGALLAPRAVGVAGARLFAPAHLAAGAELLAAVDLGFFHAAHVADDPSLTGGILAILATYIVAKSFFATLKKELIHRRSWQSKAELRTAVFDYIEVVYNRQRRHRTLGMLSPADFENRALAPPGPSLAASRLASPTKIKLTAPTASAPA